MNSLFADRITDVPRSFIREILKVALDPEIISFAGGLPNRNLFPVQALEEAASKVFTRYGSDIYQYSNSEGYVNLREYIATMYADRGITVSADNILITNGAQQGLDLLGKVIINDGDGIIMEEPGYLGAIQAFSLYKPQFFPVSLTEQGMDTDQLQSTLADHSAKLLYTVPNFQNPSGITYTEENRQDIARILEGKPIFLIEDDPYGELRFSGTAKSSFATYLPEQTILLGSFSKSVVPGFRLGWIIAPDAIRDKLLIAKQAADLHTCHFTQYIIHQYLQDNSLQTHIETVRHTYGRQCRAMLKSIATHFPTETQTTQPEGGMFLWVTLPEEMAAMQLFHLAVEKKVVFVPGQPFYVNDNGANTLRLNFSCVDPPTIEEGIQRLGLAIHSMLD